MTTTTCRICGQPVHRYSPDHPGTPDDLMGCVNSLRGALEEVEAERDCYRDALGALSIAGVDAVSAAEFAEAALERGGYLTRAGLDSRGVPRLSVGDAGGGDGGDVMECWICGATMPPDVWDMAPREPSDARLRQCPGCHWVLEMLPNSLRVANMIRHAAGVPVMELRGER